MRKSIAFAILALGALSASAQSVYPGQHAGKMAVADAVAPAALSFDLKDVRLLPGRVRGNLERDSAWLVGLPASRLLHSFRNNAGIYAGVEGGYESVRKLGGWESLDCDLRGHTTGHVLSATALMYAATGCDRFREKGDSLVRGLADAQRALGGGYVSAFPEELVNRNIRGESVWAPWYTLHKLLAGLLDQYLYADNAEALEVAKRFGDWAHAKLSPLDEETRRRMLRNEFGGVNEAFYNLYAATGEGKYLELARFFYHNDVIDPLRAGDFDMGTKHTNTFIPKLLGEARNHELHADAESLAMASGFWNTMTDRHTFASGSCSQKEHFFDPERFSDFLNGYTGESCCTYNMLKLSRHLFCDSRDPRVADFYERALFNHILGQQDPQSGMVCYFMPMLSGAYKVYSTPEQSFWCCVGSGFESHAKYAEAIYYHSGDELLVNLFIPSRLDWKEKGLVLEQLTEFPYSEDVRFRVAGADGRRLTLSLRKPGWCAEPEVRVNGKRVNVKAKDGYMSISRGWREGDEVSVTYPMELRLEATPDNPKLAAVMYGPVFLAGDMGTEGMEAPAPFSDPTVRNDYYTYDYKIPAGLDFTLDATDLKKTLTKTGEPLTFRTRDGRILRPLFDTHRTRYVTYWNLK